MKLKVLVACERSGKVREAFRKLGHDAYSCDMVAADDGSKYHYKFDAIYATQIRKWDLMIAHPPCTYLCNSGVSWLYEKKHCGGGTTTRRNAARWKKLDEATAFFRALWLADIPFIAIENPIPHKYGIPMKYDQIIQPYMFGHAESKATCLWLRNLPKLVPTKDVKAQWKSLPKAVAQRIHWQAPGPDRARVRSETFQGIADAMAEQWGNYVVKKLEATV